MCAATFALLASSLQLELAHAQGAEGRPVTIRGKISAVEGRSLKVATTSGEISVRFPDDVRIGGVAAAQLSEITAGNDVGTTGRQQADGNLKALEDGISFLRPHAARAKDTDHGTYSLAQL